MPERYRERAFLSRAAVTLGEQAGGEAPFFLASVTAMKLFCDSFRAFTAKPAGSVPISIDSRPSSSRNSAGAPQAQSDRPRAGACMSLVPRSWTRGLYGLPGPLRRKLPRLRGKDPLPPGTRRSPHSFYAILPVPAGRQRRRLRGQRLPRRRSEWRSASMRTACSWRPTSSSTIPPTTTNGPWRPSAATGAIATTITS